MLLSCKFPPTASGIHDLFPSAFNASRSFTNPLPMYPGSKPRFDIGSVHVGGHFLEGDLFHYFDAIHPVRPGKPIRIPLKIP